MSEQTGQARDAQRLAARICVVIPALNESAHIGETIRSLVEGDPALADAEVIVADGGSTDGTQAKVEAIALRFPQVRLIDNPGRSQAHAVNLGAAAAGPGRDILIRCDAHGVYPPGYLLRLARTLIARRADSVVVPMDAVATDAAGAFAQANAFIVDTPLGSGGSRHRGGGQSGYVDHGHHAAFWRDRFTALGGYDPDMVPNEDAEFDTRLTRAGGKIWLDADCRMLYYPRATFRALWRQYARYGAARARHFIKHRHQPRLRQLVPVIHAAALVGALAFVILPLGPILKGLGAGYGILYGRAMIYAVAQGLKQLPWRTALYTAPALFAMHTAWGLGFIGGGLAYLLRGAGR